MQEHLNAEQLAEYHSRRLPPEGFLKADRHLGDCAACRRRLRATAGSVALAQALEDLTEPLHPGYEQLSGYVDGLLDPIENERLEAHTLICASCRWELLDMQALEQQLALTEAPIQDEALSEQGSWMERFRRFLSFPGRVRELGLAVAMIVAGFFVMLPSTSRRAGEAGNGQQAMLTHMGGVGASPHPVFALGGFLLLAAGAALLLYTVRKRKL